MIGVLFHSPSDLVGSVVLDGFDRAFRLSGKHMPNFYKIRSSVARC